MSRLDKFKVNIPAGESGDWRVEPFEITEDGAFFFNLNCHGRAVRPGMYTRLVHRQTVIMSDTDAEIRDHLEAIYRADQGYVRVHGLGLGMVVAAILDTRSLVKRVDVVEKSTDVAKLVWPTLEARYGHRVKLILGDALDIKAGPATPMGVKYDLVWHDIWPDINPDNLADMHRLHRKWGRFTYWQGSWCRDTVERYR